MTPARPTAADLRHWLARPDSDLRIDPTTLEHSLVTAHAHTLEALRVDPLPGKRAVHYYCGTSEWGLWLAAQSAEVYLVDAEPLAIELGLRRAALSGLTRRVRSAQARQTHLDMFADSGFDLIFTSTGLLGPLADDGALAEMARILRPGARLVVEQPPEDPARLESAFQRLSTLFGHTEVLPLAPKGWLDRLFSSPKTNRAVVNARPPRKLWQSGALITARL